MVDAPQLPDEAEVRARWGAFDWAGANLTLGAREIVFRKCDR